jgi:hypothetical protein
MSWRTTAVLFGLLLILGGYVYWESRRESTPEPVQLPLAAADESVRLVTGAGGEDVRRLEVSRREDGLAASFTREDDGHWTRTVPTTTQVISQTMEYAAGNLISVTSRRSFPAGSNPLAVYGLEEPSYQVVLVLAEADGRLIRHTFHLGDRVATADGRYVQKQGDSRIHIVAGYVFDSVIELLDNPPFPMPVEEQADEESPPLQPFFELQPEPTLEP